MCGVVLAEPALAGTAGHGAADLVPDGYVNGSKRG